MATKLIISPISHRCSFSTQDPHHFIHPWPGHVRVPIRQRDLVVRLSSSVDDALVYTSSPAIAEHVHHHTQSLFLLAADSGGYSLASYYTSLGLFVISVPGLWSLIKRSVKSKVVKKTFLVDNAEKKAPSQVAGEIMSFFTRNNFAVSDRGETITFEGMMVPSRGQAALLTFCTCISLASVALVLTITYPDIGNNWFLLTVLSPLAGVYYWTKASRKEEIKVRMMVDDNKTLSEIIVQGDDQQVEQMRKELQLSEKVLPKPGPQILQRDCSQSTSVPTPNIDPLIQTLPSVQEHHIHQSSVPLIALLLGAPLSYTLSDKRHSARRVQLEPIERAILVILKIRHLKTEDIREVRASEVIKVERLGHPPSKALVGGYYPLHLVAIAREYHNHFATVHERHDLL
ncbi:Protein COFACTOR ASSEMBLY OF COMPLEX C SUBUNIT B ccb1, chloroplastic [Castilleja foliolosa]|uniref:Protein COFACTOR ASSEMBLY OF COMPLEX C SUBUNIT B ccb1, chloroplastic n=1 Tax=Castilleja foliolosa TaxID=1961234 RepID=A0ABD3DDW4_9LAMI